MIKLLFSKDIALRLGVSKATLHKKEFQKRIGLPTNRIGKRIAIPEPVFNDFIINPSKVKGDEQS